MAKVYAYPRDVSDEEWTFVLSDLLLSTEDSGSRRHSLRAVFDAYPYLLRSGCGWRLLPSDFPPWKAVYDQAARWHAAGVFERPTPSHLSSATEAVRQIREQRDARQDADDETDPGWVRDVDGCAHPPVRTRPHTGAAARAHVAAAW